MKITKNHLLSFAVLFVIFLAQFLLISNINNVQAGSLWETVGEGGLEEIGSKAYQQSGEPTDVRTITINVVRVFLTFVGIIFMILILLAGYTWMTAQGSEEKINEAKSRLKTGIIGLIIIMGAWSITYFVVRYARQAVGETTWP